MGRIRRPKRVIKTQESVETQAGTIPFVLSRSSARRTLSITVDEQARVRVASPFSMRDREILDFIHKKARWIVKGVEEARKNRAVLDQKEFDHGGEFLFLGRKYRISVLRNDVRRARVRFDESSGWSVEVPRHVSGREKQDLIKDKIQKWYRVQAREILGGRIFHYSRIMGVEPKKIGIRSQKRLWGCCDYNTKTINLNWQIILSPITVIDYVVVHELCHLVHPNHGKRFWSKVAKFMPDYQEYRKWLTANHLDMTLP